jgi:predicted Co/Zn/Cd cation transporter (cation efflux family)
MKEYWNRFLRWRGWKYVFPLPVWAEVIVFAACCAGLIGIFWNGLEQWWPAYFLYALSAYGLTALGVKLPRLIRGMQNWMQNHPKVAGILKNRELRFSAKLYLDQFINFAYGIFKILSGVIIGSAWIGADGIYNMVQAWIQLFQILRRKKPGTLVRQWRSYRFCGWLILLMHLTLIGIVFQMVNWNRVEESGEIMIIATAAFAFYKFISSFLDLAKDRKHTRPIDSSVRMLELSQAIFAMFSLQAGLLHVFGTGESWEHWLNLAMGCLVCMLTVAMGIYMIRRANREIKNLQEKEHGESLF